jgi:hypothetical protein
MDELEALEAALREGRQSFVRYRLSGHGRRIRKLKTFTDDLRIDLEIVRREVEKASANVPVGQFAEPLELS